MLEILTLLSLIAIVIYLIVNIQEIRFRAAHLQLMYLLQSAAETLKHEGSVQSAAALTELRKANANAQMLKETQAQMTMRFLKFVFGDTKK